jgi:MerR family transcriptional regulator, thiopeptide resistance regulator
METPDRALLRAKEFAEKCGVTVRTLHFYDRLGLLAPTARTDSGYRLYGESDLERIEQILALRFVGLALDQIKQLLDGPPQPLAEALRLQRRLIADEKRRLDLVLAALDEAQAAVEQSDEATRWLAVRTVIEAFKMKNDWNWTEKYYSPEALEKLAEAREKLGQEGMDAAQGRWTALIEEVEEAAKTEDPSSPRARELAKRWNELIREFTQGDPAISAGLRQLYSDESNWPQHFKKPYSDAAAAFIRKTSNSE